MRSFCRLYFALICWFFLTLLWILTLMTAVRAYRQGQRKTDNKANVWVIKLSQRLEKGEKMKHFSTVNVINVCNEKGKGKMRALILALSLSSFQGHLSFPYALSKNSC